MPGTTSSPAGSLPPFSVSAFINAPPVAVWQQLTDPPRMRAWMGEPEMRLEIRASWQPGSSILVGGFNHVEFLNTGTVLRFDPPRRLTYTQLSSISNLPDVRENHSVLDFLLLPQGGGTMLQITASNFPTEIIRKHLELYWKATVNVIREHAERSSG